MKIITHISIGLILSLCAQFLYAQTTSSDDREYSDAELEQMLAPIALYPDTVLAHVLIAATYPLEVVQAERWASENSKLSAEQALEAVENEDWDPSVKALVPFPDLLKRMSDDLDWTQNLGDAFLLSEERVMASVQALRQRAYDAGNLSSLKNVDVSRDKEIIIIEPAVREVVYIPYYDTRYVYGDWRWAHYPPVYWHSSYIGRRSHSIYWGPRVYVTHGFFFSSFLWHHHHVVVVDHHHHNRRNNNFYSGRHVASHQSARHWQHNPHHRRGVVYRNPRTRDYFESRKRDTASSNSRQDYVPRQQFNEQRRQQVTRDISEPRNRNQSATSKERRVRDPDRVSDTRVRSNERTNERRNIKTDEKNNRGDNSALIEQRKQDFERKKENQRKEMEQGLRTERRDRVDPRLENQRRIDAKPSTDIKQRTETKQRVQEPRIQRQQQPQQEKAQRQESRNRYTRTESSTQKQNNNRAARTERKERSADSRLKR